MEDMDDIQASASDKLLHRIEKDARESDSLEKTLLFLRVAARTLEQITRSVPLPLQVQPAMSKVFTDIGLWTTHTASLEGIRATYAMLGDLRKVQCTSAFKNLVDISRRLTAEVFSLADICQRTYDADSHRTIREAAITTISRVLQWEIFFIMRVAYPRDSWEGADWRARRILDKITQEEINVAELH